MLLKLYFKPNRFSGEVHSYSVYAEIAGLGAFDSLDGALLLRPEEADLLKGQLRLGNITVAFAEEASP